MDLTHEITVLKDTEGTPHSQLPALNSSEELSQSHWLSHNSTIVKKLHFFSSVVWGTSPTTISRSWTFLVISL
jgi:hypothetical protein